MKPKFYQNADNNHCLQCCIRMVLETIIAEQELEAIIDKETDYDPNLYTWTIAGAKLLSSKLSDIKIINEGFNYKTFINEGITYLEKTWGNDRYTLQSKHASKGFGKEIGLASQFLNTGGSIEHFKFSEAKIDELLKNNFVIAQLDHSKLYNLPNSSSHYILIYDQLGNNLEIHDPGKPPHQSILINKNLFMSAFPCELITIPKPSWWSPQKKVRRNDP